MMIKSNIIRTLRLYYLKPKCKNLLSVCLASGAMRVVVFGTHTELTERKNGMKKIERCHLSEQGFAGALSEEELAKTEDADTAIAIGKKLASMALAGELTLDGVRPASVGEIYYCMESWRNAIGVVFLACVSDRIDQDAEGAVFEEYANSGYMGWGFSTGPWTADFFRKQVSIAIDVGKRMGFV